MQILHPQNTKRGWGSFLIFIGFWLSPLSPWNDLFTNIPMAYAFGLLFSFISESLFFPMVVLGYWFSNVLGFILMHYGYTEIKSDKYSFKKHRRIYLLWTTLYTVLVAVLIWFKVLPSGQDILNFFN